MRRKKKKTTQEAVRLRVLCPFDFFLSWRRREGARYYSFDAPFHTTRETKRDPYRTKLPGTGPAWRTTDILIDAGALPSSVYPRRRPPPSSTTPHRAGSPQVAAVSCSRVDNPHRCSAGITFTKKGKKKKDSSLSRRAGAMVVHLHVGEAVAGEGGLGHDAGEGKLWRGVERERERERV